MRQLLALVMLCMVAVRIAEASLASTHPLSMIAPSAIGSLTACTICLVYMFRRES